MSLSVSLHPLSKTLYLHGSPDATCAYSVSGSVNITLKPPTVDTQTSDHSRSKLDLNGGEDDEVCQPLSEGARSRWESAHGSRIRTSDLSASSSSSRSSSTPFLANPSSHTNSASSPAPSTFNPNAKIDDPICSTSSYRSPTSLDSFDTFDTSNSYGSSAAAASKTTVISNIDAIDSEPGLFYNISNNCSTSHDSIPISVSKETKILLTSLVVTFEGKAEHVRDGKTINSARLCQVSQELIEEPVELSHQSGFVISGVNGDEENREDGRRAEVEGAGAGNETTYGMIFDLLTIPGWIPATLHATDSNADTNVTHRSHITRPSQESTSLTSYSLFATATYQVLYPETESTWSDTFGLGGIGKLFQACVPMPIPPATSQQNAKNTMVEADCVEIEIIRCLAPPPRISSTRNTNHKSKSLYPPTVYRISAHTKEGESPIPNDIISKFEVIAAAPRFVGMEESRVAVTLKLRCDLGDGATSLISSTGLADTDSSSTTNTSQPSSVGPLGDGRLAIERIEIDLDQDEEYYTEIHEEFKSHYPLPLEQPPIFPLLHSTHSSTTSGNNADEGSISTRSGDNRTSPSWGDLFCNWFTGIERLVDGSVRAQHWACINSNNNGICAELGICICEQQQQQVHQGEVRRGMNIPESTRWTKMRNLLDTDAPSCFVLDPTMREGTTRDLSKEEEEKEITKDGKGHVLGGSWSVINFDAILAGQNTILPTYSSPFINISQTLMVSIHVVYDGDKRDIVRFSLPIHFVEVPPTATPTTSPSPTVYGQEPSTNATQRQSLPTIPAASASASHSLCLPAYNQLFDADGEVKVDCSKGTLPLYSASDADSDSGSKAKQETAGEKSGGRKVMRPDLVPIGTEWIDWEEGKRAGWF